MARPRNRRFVPRVVVLEDRTAPATFTVTSLSDAGFGSLGEAIGLANATAEPDDIVFAANIHGGTINLTSFTNLPAGTQAVPQPAGPSAFIITSSITIVGTGETLTRAVTTPFRLFQVTPTGNLTLRNLTLSNGLAQGGSSIDGGGAAGLGGAIYNQGTLTMIGSTLTGNAAVGGRPGGGGGATGGGGLGGPGSDPGTVAVRTAAAAGL